MARVSFVTTVCPAGGCPGRVVPSMTLGGGLSVALNNAVKNLVFWQMFWYQFLRSNNQPIQVSPASEPTACTVGPTTQADVCFPNPDYGPLLDIWAPGQNRHCHDHA